MKGTVYRSTGLWYIVKLESGQFVTSRLAGKNRLTTGKLTNPIAVGDVVILDDNKDGNDHVIIDIRDRENYLIRKSPRKTEHSHIIASNLDLGIFVFTKKLPRTSQGLLDRFLVACEAYGIPVLILFHKWDIYDEDQKKELEKTIKLYESLGYETMVSSIEDPLSMEAILEAIKGNTSLFFGHSGSGKSSILNMIFPGLDLKTSELSGFSNKGRHTTTFAQMFDLDEETRVIDIPGIKEFALEDNIENYEISQFFPEIRDSGRQCKFYNCLHVNEPNCHVQKDLAEGFIDLQRYKSYLGLIEESDFKKK